MKKLIIILSLVSIAFSACNSVKSNENNDIASIDKQLQEKRAALQELQQEIKELELERRLLDPSSVDLRHVKVDTIVASNFFSTYEVQGVAESKENVILTSEANGMITNLLVREGQRVTRGQVIAQIDAEIIQRNIDEVQVSLNLATTAYERQKNLWDQNIGSQFQYLEAKSRKESLEKSLATLRAQYAKSIVRAPFTGTLDELFIRRGENVMPGSRIARVVNVDNIDLVADISESKIGTVKKGDTILVSFPSLPQFNQNAIVTLVG